MGQSGVYQKFPVNEIVADLWSNIQKVSHKKIYFDIFQLRAHYGIGPNGQRAHKPVLEHRPEPKPARAPYTLTTVQLILMELRINHATLWHAVSGK